MPKKISDEWYFYDSIDKFINEIDFTYNTYINCIKNIFDTPEIEANKYIDYLKNNQQEFDSFYPDDVEIELKSKGQERYYFVVNMKYRNLAIYIDLIYQMLEQFLISFCKFQQKFHSSDNEIKKENYRTLEQCASSFKKYFNLDIKQFYEYDKINELRLLQNVLKHSEGESKDKLINIRPDYFIDNKNVFTLYKNTIIDSTLNITDDNLKEYVDSIKIFLKQFPSKITHIYNK